MLRPTKPQEDHTWAKATTARLSAHLNIFASTSRVYCNAENEDFSGVAKFILFGFAHVCYCHHLFSLRKWCLWWAFLSRARNSDKLSPEEEEEEEEEEEAGAVKKFLISDLFLFCFGRKTACVYARDQESCTQPGS